MPPGIALDPNWRATSLGVASVKIRRDPGNRCHPLPLCFSLIVPITIAINYNSLINVFLPTKQEAEDESHHCIIHAVSPHLVDSKNYIFLTFYC